MGQTAALGGQHRLLRGALIGTAVAVAAVGIQPLHGNVFPTLLDGTPPASRSQIVLGARAFRQLGKQVGTLCQCRQHPARGLRA